MTATTATAPRAPHEDTAAENQRAVERHLQRWARYADDRLKAHHPTRPVWDRSRFLLELRADAPGLSVAQLVAVTEAFGGFVSRATVPAYGRMPALVLPGRVGQLVADLDVKDLLDVQ